MESTSGYFVAGTKNQFLVLNADDSIKARSIQQQSEQICQICGDDIEYWEEEGFFVACNECAFPVCRNCYEYERREGTQACPQCKTRYKRHRGSPRVEGDAEEEGSDDILDELNFGGINGSNNFYLPHNRLQSQSSLGQSSSIWASPDDLHHEKSSVPLLTYGEEVGGISPESHALILSPNIGFGGQLVSPIQYDKSRQMNPNKDVALYGYGTVAWKDKKEEWRQKDLVRFQSSDDGGGHFDDGDIENPNLPMNGESRQPLSRKIPIPSSKINPYRIVILLRLVILGLFFHYRILNPVKDAFGLWLTSVICEVWFAVSWILDQFPKWCPVERETYLDRLTLR